MASMSGWSSSTCKTAWVLICVGVTLVTELKGPLTYRIYTFNILNHPSADLQKTSRAECRFTNHPVNVLFPFHQWYFPQILVVCKASLIVALIRERCSFGEIQYMLFRIPHPSYYHFTLGVWIWILMSWAVICIVEVRTPRYSWYLSQWHFYRWIPRKCR